MRFQKQIVPFITIYTLSLKFPVTKSSSAPPRLPPLSKVRCCRPKEFGRLPEGLPHHYPLAPHQPSQTHTIPLAFRRGGACPSRCTEPLHPNNFLKSTSIALPRTITLASLVKGEVLSPEKIRATTGGIAFLPHPFRFSDTSVNNPSVTVTENTILCQRIFNFYKKQC